MVSSTRSVRPFTMALKRATGVDGASPYVMVLNACYVFGLCRDKAVYARLRPHHNEIRETIMWRPTPSARGAAVGVRR